MRCPRKTRQANLHKRTFERGLATLETLRLVRVEPGRQGGEAAVERIESREVKRLDPRMFGPRRDRLKPLSPSRLDLLAEGSDGLSEPANGF
jgi:hypothetical protein